MCCLTAAYDDSMHYYNSNPQGQGEDATYDYIESDINSSQKSMVEAYLTYANKGGPAFIGNTRPGEQSSTGSLQVQQKFYLSLFGVSSTSNRISSAFYYALPISGTTARVKMTTNLFADPYMCLWTSSPSPINPTITYDSSSVTVSSISSDCVVCASSYDFTSFYEKVTGVTSKTFTTNARPLFIAITEKNKIPYIAVTGGSLSENQTWGDEFINLIVLGDITIPSGKTLTIKSGTTIKVASGKKIDVSGTLELYKTLLTRSGASNWSGIDVENGGIIKVLANGCIIEYADVGIDFLGGSLDTISHSLTISNCQTAGVYAYNTSPIIRNVKCQNIGGSNGGLMVGGSSENTILRRNTVESSVHGLYVVGADASMDSCDIKDTNTDHSIIFSGGGLADLYGYNNIHPKDNYYAICNQSTGSIYAQSNYWGVVTPTDALFQFPALVTYAPFYSAALNVGVYKGFQDIERPPRKIALDLELNGDYTGAYSIYSDLFAKEQKPEWRKFYITSMLRVCDKSTHNYDDLRSKITQELLTAKGIYKGSLDFILCDILYREGRYNDAVNAFKERVANYQNDQTAVEMYARISEIYSNYLNDKASGMRYADMAKAINPGSPALRLAYEFAGSSYDPSQYTDIFGIGAPKQEPEAETIAATDFVEVYPNPANPATTISYSLSTPSKVNLAVYNISGQKVATLVDGRISAGVHAVKFEGARYASGLYFYRFSSERFTKTGKMMIVK
jgi:hypothetical protein